MVLGDENKGEGLLSMRKKYQLHEYTVMWMIAVLILVALFWQNMGDAHTINYSGIVRGATQKLVKEELNGVPDDALILRLDGIIYGLQTGKGDYHLSKNNDAQFQQLLSELNHLWCDIKAEIPAVRSGSAGSGRLYELSQVHFDIADRMVTAAEDASNRKLVYSIAIYFFCLVASICLFLFINHRDQKELEKSNRTDRMTGLLNRSGFEAAATTVLARHVKNGYVAIKFDVDDFRFINDSYGHAKGDELLHALAVGLSEQMTNSLPIARIDADDFLLLAEYSETVVTDLDARLHQIVRKLSFLGNSRLLFTFGAYRIENKDEQIKSIMDKASTAHKTAKSVARGSVVWYDEQLLEKLRREQSFTERMHRALADGEFKLYLQPKMELTTLKVIGAEALVRWDLPGIGTVFPDAFIPLFERNGSIAELDFHMFGLACSYLREHMSTMDTDFSLSVNFSRSTLCQPAFYQTFMDIVGQYGIPHNRIEIEVTESAFNEIPESLIQMLSGLRKDGFAISMDDFGAGYSNLNLIGTLPIDIIKLDREFLRQMDLNRNMRGIITCAIELAHMLGVRIICEGVEQAEHVDFLRQAGCDYVQGYFFSKPIPQDLFTEKYLYGTPPISDM